MKKQFKPRQKAKVYQIRKSTTLGSLDPQVTALVVDGVEVAWGDEPSMVARRAAMIRSSAKKKRKRG